MEKKNEASQMQAQKPKDVKMQVQVQKPGKAKEFLIDGNLKTKKPIVAESSRDIEEMYLQEKRKIDDAMKKLERQRLEEYLRLANNKKTLIELSRDNLNELERNLQNHAQKIKVQIDGLKKSKINEKSHFDKLYLLNEHLKKIETQTRDLAVSRRILLKKENDLLSDIRKFFRENQNELKHYGMRKVQDLNKIVDRKTKILAETSHLLNEDLSSIFSDKKVLEQITDKQLDKVYTINNELKKLEYKHRGLLEKRQELKTKEFEFKQMLNDIDNKRKNMIERLRKIAKK